MKPLIQCSGYPQPNLGIILILMGLLLLTHSLQELGLLFSTTRGYYLVLQRASKGSFKQELTNSTKSYGD